MKSIILKRIDEKIPPPEGAEFELRVSEIRKVVDTSQPPGLYVVDTGIWLELPDGMKLVVEGLSGFWCLKNRMGDKGIEVLVVLEKELSPGDVFASARIVEESVAKVRFVEQAPSGARVVRGSAERAEVPFVGRDMSGIQFAGEYEVKDEDSR